MKALCVFALVATFLISGIVLAGTTGKIVGTVKDARTGEPLPSANVTLEGTSFGAATNIEGYFVILNVPPGRYTLNVSLVGYRTAGARDVRVDIDQTTTQNFALSEEAVTSEEVMVVAARPVVQRDVSASRANIEIQDVKKLPLTTVTSAVSLQAGIQANLVIRGGTSDQTAFIVDGLVLQDARTNNPYTGVALSAVQDIQVQTGGFNAEYGNIRSGVVNVVTREGGKRNYSFNMTGRYAPARPKHFGPSIYDQNSYWVRPYVDDAVAWTGTGKSYETGAWDKWTRDQYSYFEGWNSISQKTLANADPKDDLTPEAAQQLWLWEYRRQAEIKDPDWDVDAGFGGPVPFGESLGGLRFFASYRQARNYYLVPLSRSSFDEQNFQLKLTTDLMPAMKLQLTYMYGYQGGTNSNNSGEPGLFTTPGGVASVMDRVSYIDARIFATDYWAPSATHLDVFGAKLTHNVSSTVFYEATLQRYSQKTDTYPGTLRDPALEYKFGNSYYVDEAPFGYQPKPSTGITGLRMGVGFSNSRDTSRVSTILGRFDITGQLDRFNLVKSGVEVSYTDNNVNSASVDEFLPSGRYRTTWHNYPWRVSAYLQDKLEFEGMIANVGVRMDYLTPNGDWYENYNPYDPAFSGAYSQGIDTLLQKGPVKAQVNWSPRLGVAFPITDDAKLFFNYGHFYQIPDPRNLFLLRRYLDNNQVVNLADPTNKFPRTIAYELGYEHSLLDEYLIRVAAYYKDISNETQQVNYINRNSTVDYNLYQNTRYRDIRGLELTLTKNRGMWVQGFANYTYDVRTTGYFGYPTYYENPTQQRNYQIEQYSLFYQEKPLPAPYARVNLDLFTPDQWGPNLGPVYIFDNWRINFLFNWSSGDYFTWTGGGGSVPGIQYNVQWRDYYNLDMRISKTFRFGKLGLELFADIYNALNTKTFSHYGFFDGTDFTLYMQSLHLPKDVGDPLGYGNIPGSDRPGDYRKEGAAYQPIVSVGKYSDLVNATTIQYQQTRPFYYALDNGNYYQFVNGGYQQVDPGRLNQVMDDKAYIDMPNQETFVFLNPRKVFFGLRLSFDM
jgi:hypothetical protein